MKTKEQLEHDLKIAERELAVRDAKDSLLKFIQLDMDDPDHPDDCTHSRYVVTPQAKLLTQAMEDVESGKKKRLAVSISPQTGKTQIISIHAIAWILGRNKRINIIVGTYNETRAGQIGDEVREVMRGRAFQQVFPDFKLARGSENKFELKSTTGAKVNFVGMGGSTTGMACDIFVIDDPIKNEEEAASPTFRESMWSWFNTVVTTRCHRKSRIIIVHTRWNEDDLIGRLCDPGHPERNKRFRNISKNWPFLNIPVVVTDPALAAALGLKLTVPTDPDVIEAFGQVPMSSLWEDKFPLTLMAEFKTLDARSFDALRMGRPSPVDGFYFKDSMLVEYEAHELPNNLRFYGASDHAVSKKQGADSSVIGCFGIDPDRTIWILPDVFWGKKDSKEMVDELIHQFITHKPALWWMEDELISKSFGPFLQDRMNEDGVYQTIDPVRPSKDKELRARSIQGRMQMQKVRFPRFAPWWPDAKKQVLKFPFGAHDDFVDWLSLIGLGLSKEYAPRRTEDKSENIIETGSIKWILAQTRMKARSEQRKTANGGW